MVDPELVAIGAEASARSTDLGVTPEPGGEGEEPHPDAGAQARECAGAVALEAELSLQVQKTDSIHWRTRPSDPNWSGSSLRSGRRNSAPRSAIQPSNSAPAKPLSAMTVRPASGTRSSISRATSRSGAFAGASSKAIGVPSLAQSRERRKPQK